MTVMEQSGSKETFLQPMYHTLDSDDEDLDNFTEFRRRNSQHAVHSQDETPPSTEIDVQQNSSQTSETSLQQQSGRPPLPARLKNNYVSKSDRLDWLQWDKKELAKAKPQRLKDLVLFYWPYKKPAIRLQAYKGVLQCGAEIAIEWDEGHRVTHIVCDPGAGREYKDLLKNLKLDTIPSYIQVIKAGWVDEKMRGNNVSENGYRISGYRLPPQVPSRIDLVGSKKRSASEAQPVSADANAAKHQKMGPPALKKHSTDGNPGFPTIRDADDIPKSFPSSSPKFMKQSVQVNFGVRLGTEARRSGIALKTDNDALDEAIEQNRRRNAIRYAASNASYSTDEVTNDGRNIDILHQIQYTGNDEELSSDLDDGELLEMESLAGEILESTNPKAKNFLCAKKSLKGTKETGPNAALIQQLQILADHYSTKKDDAFRAKGYREAISVLRRQKQAITTSKQALDLRRIGSSIATKIEEFGQYGKIHLVDTITSDPKEQVLKLFTGIYGVAQRTADDWYNRGFRTLDDIKKIDLHNHQRIGLEHYEDFNARIPRSEVTSHVEYVSNAAQRISPHLEVVVGGSYRRGQLDSGDIDFLITAPDSKVSTAKLHNLVFQELIPVLRDIGYIKADLTHSSDKKSSSKWLGAACLPDGISAIWRRVDILLVPNEEWGAALLYFTGNDIFNRSMRLLARRGGGSLNQHGLFKNVVRERGVKVDAGVLVEGRDEKKIFEALGVKWRPPYERCP